MVGLACVGSTPVAPARVSEGVGLEPPMLDMAAVAVAEFMEALGENGDWRSSGLSTLLVMEVALGRRWL